MEAVFFHLPGYASCSPSFKAATGASPVPFPGIGITLPFPCLRQKTMWKENQTMLKGNRTTQKRKQSAGASCPRQAVGNCVAASCAHQMPQVKRATSLQGRSRLPSPSMTVARVVTRWRHRCRSHEPPPTPAFGPRFLAGSRYSVTDAMCLLRITSKIMSW